MTRKCVFYLPAHSGHQSQSCVFWCHSAEVVEEERKREVEEREGGRERGREGGRED